MSTSYSTNNKMNDIYENGLAVEKHFCKNNLDNLRRCFDWIDYGKYIAEYDTYSPYDGELVFDKNGEQGIARFDIKYTSLNRKAMENKFTLSKTCYEALQENDNSYLFIYSKPDQTLYAVMVGATYGFKDGDKIVIHDIASNIVDSKKWPLTL